MASVVQRLADKNMLNSPPAFMKNGMQLEVIMGSIDAALPRDTGAVSALREIQSIIDRAL